VDRYEGGGHGGGEHGRAPGGAPVSWRMRRRWPDPGYRLRSPRPTGRCRPPRAGPCSHRPSRSAAAACSPGRRLLRWRPHTLPTSSWARTSAVAAPRCRTMCRSRRRTGCRHRLGWCGCACSRRAGIRPPASRARRPYSSTMPRWRSAAIGPTTVASSNGSPTGISANGDDLVANVRGRSWPVPGMGHSAMPGCSKPRRGSLWLWERRWESLCCGPERASCTGVAVDLVSAPHSTW
jgi:hypothetical protein